MFFSKKEKLHTGKVGGIFYFFSLTSVLLISVLLFRFSLEIAFDVIQSGSLALLVLTAGVIIGFLVSKFLPAKLTVFIHELKHSLFSNLVGNRFKSIQYGESSGYFKYTYTKDTAHMNAFISLAPYTLPLFSLLSFLPTLYFLASSQPPALLIFAVCLGLDLRLNLQDIGPHQSDLTEVRGGYYLSLLYILAFNVCWLLPASLTFVAGPQVLLDFIFWLLQNLQQLLLN